VAVRRSTLLILLGSCGRQPLAAESLVTGAGDMEKELRRVVFISLRNVVAGGVYGADAFTLPTATPCALAQPWGRCRTQGGWRCAG
jgi:hypothetical protein